jgi:uncharacterized alpha-E superfamily protein
MLSRVADCLYWLGRNVERAENIARIVDVNLQLMLDAPIRESRQLKKNWLPIAACLGEDERLQKKQRRVDSERVADFLVFDRENPNSISSCLFSARENARTVRERISTEMWEHLNRAYLWSAGAGARKLYQNNQYGFFQNLKEICYLFHGITDSSLSHDERWEFLQVGKFLERAEKTSRVVDEEYHLLRQNGKSPSNEHLQWTAVLRSCSARQAYQRIYVSDVQASKVADLLILNKEFPRSIEFCVLQVDQSLRRLSGVLPGKFSNAAEKLSGRLAAELNFSSIEEIIAPGLHAAMDTLQVQLNQIGEAIFRTYIDPVIPESPEVAAQAEAAQQQ